VAARCEDQGVVGGAAFGVVLECQAAVVVDEECWRAGGGGQRWVIAI